MIVIIRSMDMMSKHGPSLLLFNSCVNLGESLNLTGPQLSPLQNGHNCSSSFLGLLRGLSETHAFKVLAAQSGPGLCSRSQGCFYCERVSNFVKYFLCVNWDDLFFSFILLVWCVTLISFCMLSYPCIPGINRAWSWYVILLLCCWIRFASLLLKVFASIFFRDLSL